MVPSVRPSSRFHRADRRTRIVPYAPRIALWIAPSLVLGACMSATSSSDAPGEHAATSSIAPSKNGKKALTLDALYGEGDAKVDFSGSPPGRLVWLDDAHYLWPKSDPKTHKSEWLRVEAATGKSEPFADMAKLEAAMLALPEVKTAAIAALPEKQQHDDKAIAEEAGRMALRDPSSLSKDHTKVLFTISSGGEGRGRRSHSGSDLYAYTFGAEHAVRLTSTPEDEEENAQWSPDGNHVSFVRKNDLYVVDLEPVAEHRITSDGGDLVLNGKLDWLYQEEVYGRGNFGAAWWSADSKSIAFLRLDEHGVPPYTLVNDIPWRPDVETSPYPRSGETNPTVKLGVASVNNGSSGTRWVDLAKYSSGDFLIVDVTWSPKNELTFQVQDREQIWLDLNAVDLRAGAETVHLHRAASDGARTPYSAKTSQESRPTPDELNAAKFAMLAAAADSVHITIDSDAESDTAYHVKYEVTAPMHTLFRETSPAWVDNPGAPHWLADGSFLLASERSGWKHIYHFKSDGTLIGAVTSGKWEARTLHGIDEKNGWVYFSGTERSPIGGDAYRIKLDGTGMQRLTQARGTHDASFNPPFTQFVDHWSNITTPPQVRLHRADGTEVRVIDENRVPALADYELSTPEFLQVKTRDGFAMEAMLIKPPDFDPTKRYPVFQSTYAGPHSPSVHDAWGGTGLMFLHLIAQKGVVVWVCDNRTASGKGAESEWPLYKRFGESELADIEDGVAWLKQQPWVDATRIGISGWSFGGFMTSYALTHSQSFAMGIAGGTVSDWMNYDSIYTERYMMTPEHNKDGYKRTSVTAAAKSLHGDLLLIHGAIDDNVHPQSSMQLAYELQKADKQFDFMLYPKSRHGVSDRALVRHMRGMMLEFIERTLLRTNT
jgi:dipeptidyl aminopeptidase/acylaminoacyl peptidase